MVRREDAEVEEVAEEGFRECALWATVQYIYSIYVLLHDAVSSMVFAFYV